jgi:hypothetical protein
MRNHLISILMTAALASGIVGCRANSPSNSGESTKMNAAMACCGDSCKAMGSDCCKIDDKGAATCSMGGSCCVKADNKMKM